MSPCTLYPTTDSVIGGWGGEAPPAAPSPASQVRKCSHLPAGNPVVLPGDRGPQLKTTEVVGGALAIGPRELAERRAR